jgi:hypothetical protein
MPVTYVAPCSEVSHEADLPQPLISVALLVTWLLLNNAIAPGCSCSGVLLAVALPLGPHASGPSTRDRPDAPLLR